LDWTDGQRIEVNLKHFHKTLKKNGCKLFPYSGKIGAKIVLWGWGGVLVHVFEGISL
jgi:hypothetical protein